MTTRLFDSFGARAKLKGTDYHFYRLDKLSRLADIHRLPFSIKILLEALLRTADGYEVMPADVERLARWSPQMGASFETVSYTHLRAHETVLDLVCRLLLEKKNIIHTYCSLPL